MLEVSHLNLTIIAKVVIANSFGFSSIFLSPLRNSGGVSTLSGYAANYSPQLLANDPLLSGSTPKGKVSTVAKKEASV